MAGGLGNQFFQLATSSLIAKKGRKQVIVLTAGLKKYKVMRNADSLTLVKPNGWALRVNQCSRFKEELIIRFRIGRWLPFVGVTDGDMRLENSSLDDSSIVVLDGYFQDFWTTEKIKIAISGLKIAPTSNMSKGLIQQDEVVIHVRGGDFIGSKEHSLVDEKYYNRAIRHAMRHSLRKFAIVTDDLMYASRLMVSIKKINESVSIRVLPPSDVFTDFNILRSASAKIIGNSTFAWWSAALTSNPAFTVSPNRFTLTGKQRQYLADKEIQISM